MPSALYQETPPRGFEGAKATAARIDDVLTGVNISSSGVKRGKFVARDTAAERSCKVLSTLATGAPRSIMGLVLREVSIEAADPAQYDVLSIMRVGYAWVIPEDAFEIGDPVFVRCVAAGAEVAGSVRASADGTDCVRIPGVFLTTGDAATLGMIFFDLGCIEAEAIGGLALAPADGVQGDILVHNGTAYVRLAKGTDGQVLKMVSGAPAWAADAT
jgi:hypothetical protein